MSQCVIQTRVMKEGAFSEEVTLEPIVHQALYNLPALDNARRLMLANDEIHQIGVVLGPRYYSVIRIAKGHPYALELDPEASAVAQGEAGD